MGKRDSHFIIFFFIIFFIGFTIPLVRAQSVTISGKITDAESGEGMPLVNIVNKTTGKGTTTNFEGYYKLILTSTTDSLSAFYVGYKDKSKALKGFQSQNLDFQLEPDAAQLEEFTVTAGENPAFWIIRKAVKNKDIHDKRKLNSYQYESFTKNELHIDNLSDKFRKKKIFKKVVQIFDSLKVLAGDEGKPVLPVFVSETMSEYYYHNDPRKTKEVIQAIKVIGVGFDEDSPVTQLIGSSFQQYNFYMNWLTILNKEFISPLADGWMGYYNFTLQDSTMHLGRRCYKIDFRPKRPQDLAFKGTMWIADSSFALQQIDATVGKECNINFIQKIKIQQELEPTTTGPWLPTKTRVLINVEELNNAAPGVLAKFYVSNKNIIVNDPKPTKFFDMLVDTEDDATNKDDSYWIQHRHDTVSETEKHILKMIDSVRNIPQVRGYVDIVNLAVNGYKRFPYVDVGPFLNTYAYNGVEGHRFRLGARSNINFSRRWLWKGYTAYGTKDDKIKYNVSVSYIFSKRHWTFLTLERKMDYEQAGVQSEFLESNLFASALQWGQLRGAYFSRQNVFAFQAEPKKDFTQKIFFKTKTFEPSDAFNFSYYRLNEVGTTDTIRDFKTTEITFETRYAKDEMFVQSDLNRISLGTKRAPIYNLRYTQGIKGVLGSDFNYYKLNFTFAHIIRWGVLGRTYYEAATGKVFGNVPYPLLEVHMGNESFYYTQRAYNLMNYFEFVSDQYVSLKLRHYFEGLFFNKIPLIRKLKWRFLATSNILYGSVRKENLDIIPPKEPGTNLPAFYTLEQKPYVEVGYGIENIFRVMRIDFFHRLTYKQNEGARDFGIKISAQFNL